MFDDGEKVGAVGGKPEEAVADGVAAMGFGNGNVSDDRDLT